MAGPLTGHCHLKGHLFKIGLTNSPICDSQPEIEEPATHILSACEATVYSRFRHPEHYFTEPSVTIPLHPCKYDTALDSRCSVVNGLKCRGRHIRLKVAVERPAYANPASIHSYSLLCENIPINRLYTHK
jgi:hypothetical protein